MRECKSQEGGEVKVVETNCQYTWDWPMQHWLRMRLH